MQQIIKNRRNSLGYDIESAKKHLKEALWSIKNHHSLDNVRYHIDEARDCLKTNSKEKPTSYTDKRDYKKLYYDLYENIATMLVHNLKLNESPKKLINTFDDFRE